MDVRMVEPAGKEYREILPGGTKILQEFQTAVWLGWSQEGFDPT